MPHGRSIRYKLEQPTVYTDYSDPSRLAAALGSDDDPPTYRHPLGYDIIILDENRSVPAAVRTTLLLDQILGQYRNAIITLPDAIDATSMVLLEHAAHLALVVPPGEEGLRRLRRLRADHTRYTASGRTGLTVIVTCGQAAPPEQDPIDEADYVLPLLDLHLSLLQTDMEEALPESVAQVGETLIERIDRSHQIAIHIPTTIAIDQTFDTTAYVERTLAFLGSRFGGATSKHAEGVWRSDMAGLVSETVYSILSIATPPKLI